MSDNPKIIIELDPDDEKNYLLDLPLMSIEQLYNIARDICHKVETGYFGEVLEVSEQEDFGPGNILN